MIVEEYGVCPNCEHEIKEDSKFCNECGTKLEWKEYEAYFLPKPEQNVMRYGTINCDCGRSLYFETLRLEVRCIQCNKKHDVSSYPIKGGEVDEA